MNLSKNTNQGAVEMVEDKTENHCQKLVAGLKDSKSGPEETDRRLGQCELRLDQILESLPYPFYVIDASDFTIKAANAAAGFGPLTNASTCHALTHNRNKPCSSAEHPCPIAEIKQTKRPVTVAHVHCDKNGRARNVEIHAFPVFDNEGKVTRIIEYVLDVTERKQAEDTLKWELSVNAALSQLYEPLVSPEASIESIACAVLEQANLLTGSEHGYVWSSDPTIGNDNTHTYIEMVKGQCRAAGKNRKIVFPNGKDGPSPASAVQSLNTGQAFYSNLREKHQEPARHSEGRLPIHCFLSVRSFWLAN
jgi:PAS fold